MANFYRTTANEQPKQRLNPPDYGAKRSLLPWYMISSSKVLPML